MKRGLNMNAHYFDMKTLRLALSGALIGVALVNLTKIQFPYHDIVGGVVGFVATLFAKYRHLF